MFQPLNERIKATRSLYSLLPYFPLFSCSISLGTPYAISNITFNVRSRDTHAMSPC